MSALIDSARLLATHNPATTYFVIYVATIFLGNLAIFTALWFVLWGYLGSWGFPLFMLTIFAADVTGDIMWYGLGRTLRDTRIGTFIKNHLPRHEKLEANLHESTARWIFLAKFLYSANFPIIFMVGWSKIPFNKFFRTALVAIISWFVIILTLSFGVIAGVGPISSAEAIENLELRLLIGVILFIILNFLFKFLIEKIIRRERLKKLVDFILKFVNGY